MNQRHGEAGHLNVLVRDQDSEVTSYGKHNRLTVGRLVDSGQYIVCEHIKHGLPMSSEEDRQRVAKGYQRLHPRGTSLKWVCSSTPYSCQSFMAIDHTYEAFRHATPLRPEVIALKTESGSRIFRTVPMRRFASGSPAEWLRFQGQHVPGTRLSEGEQARLQAFMTRHGSEAITNGVDHFTLAGGMLAFCHPDVIH